jgi:pilus assembly protein CpaB
MSTPRRTGLLVSRWPRELRRRILVHRRGLAALFAGVAVLVALRSVQSPAPPTVGLWTASHDLPSGTVLSRDDLTRVPFAPDSVPDHAAAAAGEALGRTVAAPVRRGEPITDLRLVAGSLLVAYPGRVATPVRLADSAVVDLLRVGDVVDLVAADPQGQAPARVVSSGVSVIAIPARRGTQQDLGLTGRLVLLAVPATDAADVSAAGVSGFLTVTLTR